MTTYSSTINPLLPAMDAPIASAPVRGNFAAAVNDIDFIYGLIAALPTAAGTVTSVSGTNANGITWSVANPTTAANITISLGAITPSSVNGITLSGSATPTLTVTGTTSVSGSNTGDQTSVSGNAGTVTTINGHITAGTNVTITGSGTQASPYSIGGNGGSGTVTEIDTGTGLTGGPITASGTIAIATNTANTLAGFNNSGVFSDVAVGSGLALSSGTLTATGGGTGTVTTTGSPASGNLSKFSGTTSITNGDLSGDVTTSGTLATTVAKIAGVAVGTPTGTTNVVFSNSPTLVTPALGTPSSGNLGSCTAYPGDSSLVTTGTITTGVWHGTKVGLAYGGTNADLSATGAASNVLKQVSSGASITVGQLAASDLSNGTTGSGGGVVLATGPTLSAPVLGTPASGTLTNCTGTASGLTAGTVTTNANLTGDVTSVGNATTVAKIAGVAVGTPTGTTNVVFSNSPTLVTPALGTPSSGNLGSCTAYPGDSSLVTTGTITTGVWHGTKVGLAYGGTNADLSATGAASNVLKQVSSGASITVGQLAASDLSNGTTGSGGGVVLATGPTLSAPVLGTPASGTLTNCTGTASGLTAGTVTTNANLTGDVTSVGNATTVAKIAGVAVGTPTGTTNVVFSASPTLTGTPLSPTATAGTNTTQIATTAFVQAALNTQVDMHDPVVLATTAVLSNSPTYSNGSSGVGATLTAGSVGVLTVDGVIPSVGQRILVKNQAATLQNGCYTLTTAGVLGTVDYILTRATDFNTAATIGYGDSFPVLQGTVNANQQFTMNSQTFTTVGAGDSTGYITFAQTSGGSQLTSGTGILITGNSVATAAPTVSGPASAVSGNVPTFNGTTGILIQDGGTALSSLVVSGGALGTPASGTLTNCTFPTLNQSTTGNAATATTSSGLTSATTTVVVSAATAPTSGQVLTASSTTAASWLTPTAAGGYRALSSTDTVVASDNGKTLAIAGTCALALTAAATVGSFSCFVQNTATSGIQIITITPNGSDNLDGANSTLVILPGEVRELNCNGTAWFTEVVAPFVIHAVATASPTLPRTGYRGFAGNLWGSGASGGNGATDGGGGGGGGAYNTFTCMTNARYNVNSMALTLTVGATVTGQSSANTAGTAGNTSSVEDTTNTRFLAFAYGGGAGGGSSLGAGGGGGSGGNNGAGPPNANGTPNASGVGANAVTTTAGAGGGYDGGAAGGAVGSQGGGGGGGNSATKLGGYAVYDPNGGSGSSFACGGGGGGCSVATTAGAGGQSLWGGGGGGGASNATGGAGGASTNGGSGGAGSSGSGNGTAGTAPGGGGGGSVGNTSGGGAVGEINVWGIV